MGCFNPEVGGFKAVIGNFRAVIGDFKAVISCFKAVIGGFGFEMSCFSPEIGGKGGTGCPARDAPKPQVGASCSHYWIAYFLYEVCQVFLPHWGQCIRRRGCPDAFQRMPPVSHHDRSNPQGHFNIHTRDSASMLSAQRRGSNQTKNL